MLHKWLEKLVDTILFLLFLTGLLAGFCLYWRSGYEIRCAELLIMEFLENSSREGGVFLEEYEALQHQLYRWNTSYTVELYCRKMELEPCYARLPETLLKAYYMERNVRQEIPLERTMVQVEEENAETLRMQEETNETILAAASGQFLPLPEEETVLWAEAVRKVQHVYEGEEVITLCMVHSETGNYYAEAEPVKAEQSGEILLTVPIGDGVLTAEAELICYPRKVVCERGHEYVNSKKIIEGGECPYCLFCPEKIESNIATLFCALGQSLGETVLYLTVTFPDGHEELVTPETPGWQDDFDKNYCGIQTVNLWYGGMEEQIVVVTEAEACKKCGKDCTARCYSDYKAYPFCTECMSKVPLFTGEVLELESLVTSEQIISRLDQEGGFILEEGDWLTVCLKKDGVVVSMLQSPSRKNWKEE